MHSAAEELSTGPRLTTVMKPILVRGEGEATGEEMQDASLKVGQEMTSGK